MDITQNEPESKPRLADQSYRFSPNDWWQRLAGLLFQTTRAAMAKAGPRPACFGRDFQPERFAAMYEARDAIGGALWAQTIAAIVGGLMRPMLGPVAQSTSCSPEHHEMACATSTTFEVFAIPMGYRIGGGLPARQLGTCRRCRGPLVRNLSGPERRALSLATGRSDT